MPGSAEADRAVKSYINEKLGYCLLNGSLKMAAYLTFQAEGIRAKSLHPGSLRASQNLPHPPPTKCISEHLWITSDKMHERDLFSVQPALALMFRPMDPPGLLAYLYCGVILRV